MSYFSDLDAWLDTVLEFAESEDDEQWIARVKKQIKDEILKSYRNGQKAGLPPKDLPTADKPATKRESAERPKRRYFRGR